MPKAVSRWRRWTKIFRPKDVVHKWAWAFVLSVGAFLVVRAMRNGDDFRGAFVLVLLVSPILVWFFYFVVVPVVAGLEGLRDLFYEHEKNGERNKNGSRSSRRSPVAVEVNGTGRPTVLRSGQLRHFSNFPPEVKGRKSLQRKRNQEAPTKRFAALASTTRPSTRDSIRYVTSPVLRA